MIRFLVLVSVVVEAASRVTVKWIRSRTTTNSKQGRSNAAGALSLMAMLCWTQRPLIGRPQPSYGSAQQQPANTHESRLLWRALTSTTSADKPDLAVQKITATTSLTSPRKR